MWEDVLKAPNVQPFEMGAVRPEGPIRPDDKKLPMMGLHPLPLLGSYINLLHKMIANNPAGDNTVNKEWNIEHQWLKGRVKTVGDEYNPETGKIEKRPFKIVEKLNNYIAYRKQDQPPSWEEFVSKLDEPDEFVAASVIFGKDFPKSKQDLTRYTKPSFRFKTPKQQAHREARVLNRAKAKYDEEVEKLYVDAHERMSELTKFIDGQLSEYVNSESYKKIQNPKLMAKQLLTQVIGDLKGDKDFTSTTHGINLWWKPDWDDVSDNFLLRIKMNISQPPEAYCIDEYRVDSGKKFKVKTLCLSANQGLPVGDTYAAMLLGMNNFSSKRDFMARMSWSWVAGGRPGANKYIDWKLGRLDKHGRAVQNVIRNEAIRLKEKFEAWGRYWERV